MQEFEQTLVECDDIHHMSYETGQIAIAAFDRGARNFGIAVGRTQYEFFDLIAKDTGRLREIFEQITYQQYDEYIGLDINDPERLLNVIRARLWNHLSRPEGLEHTFNIKSGQLSAAELLEEVNRIEDNLERIGGLHYNILGIGDDGHFLWNMPGAPHDGRTFVGDIGPALIQNAEILGHVKDDLSQGISLGMANLSEATHGSAIMISGINKAKALQKLLYDDTDSNFPAHASRGWKDVTIYADKAARSLC